MNQEFRPLASDTEEPEKKPGRVVRAVKYMGRHAALFGVLLSAKEGLAPDQAFGRDRHSVEKSETKKGLSAREKLLNKWLKDFDIKTLGVLDNTTPKDVSEVLALFLKGRVQAVLDSGGYILTPDGEEDVAYRAEIFDEKLLKEYVKRFLEEHTDFKVIDKAQPGAEKKGPGKHKNKHEDLKREGISGILVEFDARAKQVMQETGVSLADGKLVLADRQEISFDRWEKVKRVVVRAQGEKGLLVEVHSGKQTFTEEILNGTFFGTVRGGTK